jgi:agmatine/peptidylarginine deiminase
MTKVSANTFLPAEWYPQSGVMLTWPHAGTDWAEMLDEVEQTFIAIAREIAMREQLLIVCPDAAGLKKKLAGTNLENVHLYEVRSNDTWARDHGPITVFRDGAPILFDFRFNGWGQKFPSNHDNQITRRLFNKEAFSANAGYANFLQFVLEGGAIESDGEGTILTTTECMLSLNRNEHMNREEIEHLLTDVFGLKRILWLHNGRLAGDDTDSHVDTLARFCDAETIAYVNCSDPEDGHFEALQRMEDELKSFTTLEGKPYRLLALPMADAVYDDGDRLPATYANFLILNNAVLLPFYGTEKDEEAGKVLQEAFPDREVVGINCLPLIKQHGSLHCVTMQFPKGVL